MKLSKLTIGQRILAGFGAVLVLMAVSVLLTLFGVNSVVDNAKEVISGNRLDGLLAQREVDHLTWANKLSATLSDPKADQITVETDHSKCALGHWLYGQGRQEAEAQVPALTPLLKQTEEAHKRLHQSAIAIAKVFRPGDAELPGFLAAREADHLRWSNTVAKALLNHEPHLGVETDPTKCALGKWLASPEAAALASNPRLKALLEQIVEPHQRLHATAIAIQGALDAGQMAKAQDIYQQQTEAALTDTGGVLKKMIEEAKASVQGKQQAEAIYNGQTLPALGATQGLLHQLRATARKAILTDEAMLAQAQDCKIKVSAVGALTVLGGLLLAFFIARSISGVLRRISGHMGEGASLVSAASSQVASTSQSLAQGSSEQAASLENTSAALEEVAAMIRQNADNAQQANSLMDQSGQVVSQALESMDTLRQAMARISEASEQTGKIIKTIDEIAFQTNLLALNAAVEAARAGEAGAGFAVVAEEVRNLAMRAAEAAKNTQAIIEQNLRNIAEGSELVRGTDEAFGQVAHSAQQVGALVAEIAAASSEQAQGIEAVNHATRDMDQVTQQTASGAEESASAAEELDSQAHHLQDMVGDLLALVGRQQVPRPSRRAGAGSRPLLPQPMEHAAWE
ncbi:MAG: methyl-accepting chemotaxis protein [Pseudomonadota bacterium]